VIAGGRGLRCHSDRPRKKAAESLELQVLRIETAEQIELARQLPSGEIRVPGRGNMPVVRQELLDKLLALVPTPVSSPSKEAASATKVDAATSVTATDNSEPASKEPCRLANRAKAHRTSSR
jgi:hypothetical protein